MAKTNNSNQNSPWTSGGGFWTSTGSTYSNKGFTFEFLEDYFIDMTMSIPEERIREMLLFLKSRDELIEAYVSVLYNLFMHPKKRLFSEDLIIEFYGDTVRSGKFNSTKFDFEKAYREFLDKMPKLRLLMSLEK